MKERRHLVELSGGWDRVRSLYQIIESPHIGCPSVDLVFSWLVSACIKESSLTPERFRPDLAERPSRGTSAPGSEIRSAGTKRSGFYVTLSAEHAEPFALIADAYGLTVPQALAFAASFALPRMAHHVKASAPGFTDGDSWKPVTV